MPYRMIDDPVKLRRVLQATLLLEGDLQLHALLRHVVEEARSITGARYGALGVLNEDRTGLAEFVTVGLEPDEEDAIGQRPTGRGVLGLLIVDPKPLRVRSIGQHPDSYGFPPNHPPMTSFLGVPIKVRDEVYGNLYLTDKVGWNEFTDDDVALVEALSVAAGIAIENARLHEHVRVAAVYEDRDRLARDLHDTVIQRLFGVGLTLQSMTSRAPDDLGSGIQAVVGELDQIIQQIRSTIYELGMRDKSRGVRDTLMMLVREARPNLGFEVAVSFNGPIETALTNQVAENLVAVVREAVSNIGRHAQATAAWASITVEDGWCRVVVRDNGHGLDGALEDPTRGGGLGVPNLRSRAEKLNGKMEIRTHESGGTILTWAVPLSR